MRKTGPKISVLVPTYNYARFLPQAIESILAQTGADFEVFISDDASTDDSAERIRRYAARDSRIRVALHSTNLGMVANWNWCLQQARGDYIKYVFGDDLLTSPGSLARMANLLDQQPDAALVASARVLLDQDSNVTGSWDHLLDDALDGPQLIARCLRTRRNLIGEPSAVMFRRQLAMRGFDPAYRQIVDLEMWFHLMTQGQLRHTPELLCGFRQHISQQTVVNGHNRVTDLELIALLDRYQSHPQVRTHLPQDGWAHGWILYRQLHYARKAIDRSAAASAVARLEARIPRFQRAIYWFRHRLTRPMENLARKFTQWSQAPLSLFSPQRILRRKIAENFIHSLTLPQASHSDRQPETRRSHSTANFSNNSSSPSLVRAFQQKLPRQIAAGLVITGMLSAGGIFLIRPMRPQMHEPAIPHAAHPLPHRHSNHRTYERMPFRAPPDITGRFPPNHPFSPGGYGDGPPQTAP